MKRTIFVELLLICVTCCLLGFAIYCFAVCENSLTQYYAYVEYEKTHFVPEDVYYEEFRSVGIRYLLYGLLFLGLSAADLAAMVIIAICPLPGFKPLVKKLQAKKEARANLRAEKAEAEKQKRIDDLQAELDELKKGK